MSTSLTGSMMLACIGRGDLTAHVAPSDNKGNTYIQIGTAKAYPRWPSSGTALYACAPLVGGSSHVVTAAKPAATDETTMSVVEVFSGRVVYDVKWNAVAAGQTHASLSVTTAGPALLVAWWWGDDYSSTPQVVSAGNGFTVVDAVTTSNNFVQCAVATRQVAAAGSYNVQWTVAPIQGAQLWIAAIQAA